MEAQQVYIGLSRMQRIDHAVLQLNLGSDP